MLKKIILCCNYHYQVKQAKTVIKDYKVEPIYCKMQNFFVLENIHIKNVHALSAEMFGFQPLIEETLLIKNTSKNIKATFVIPSPAFKIDANLNEHDMFKKQIKIPLEKILHYEDFIKMDIIYGIHIDIAFVYENNFNVAIELFKNILNNYSELSK